MSGTDVVVLVNTEHADTPYDEWTAGTEVRPWLLVSDERYHGYRHLPGTRRYPTWPRNLRLELDAWELSRSVGATAIVARSEPDILRAARLREALGLPGQNWRSALAFRDKVVMKNLLAEHGLPLPAFTELRTGTDLVRFVEEHGYPVVVKPVTGSGSFDTHVLRHRADLLSWLDRGTDTLMEAETFVDGVMYHVDGLVLDGKTVAADPSRYINDCLSFRTGEFLGSCMLTETHPLHQRLVDCAEQVLAALPTPDTTTFHIEIWHTPADELVVCEAASRTGGGRVVPTLRHATGLDVDREWFNAQVGLPVSGARVGAVESGHTAGWVLFYPRVGTLAALPDEDPPSYVLDARTTGAVGRRYGGGYKSGHYLSAYVVEGATDEQVEARIGELTAWFDERVRWTDGNDR